MLTQLMDDIYVAKIETDSFADSQQQFLPTSGEVTRTSRGCDEGEGGNLYGNITSYACLADASFTDPSLIIFFSNILQYLQLLSLKK